jgi:hypothetical protein
MKPIKMEVQFGNVGSIMFFHITIVIFKVGKEQITEKNTVNREVQFLNKATSQSLSRRSMACSPHSLVVSLF